MSIINKLASSLNRRDEVPNQELAKQIAANKDKNAVRELMDNLANKSKGKDTIQFPYDKPLPKELILKIALYRAKDVRENNALWMERT